RNWAFKLPNWATINIAVVSSISMIYFISGNDRSLVRLRNFYGEIKVDQQLEIHPPQRRVFSGRIVHGIQLLESESRLRPAGYYGLRTGFGRAISARGERGPVN